MSEKADRLKTTLSELRAELDGLEAVDPEVRNMLEGAVKEIGDRLEGRPPKPSDSPTLADRLTDATRHFEGTHPTLASLLENTIDLLARMGI